MIKFVNILTYKLDSFDERKRETNISLNIKKYILDHITTFIKGDVKKIGRGKHVFYKIKTNYKGPERTTAKVRLYTEKEPISFGCKLIGDYNFVRIFKWAVGKFEYRSMLLSKDTLTSIEVKS